MRTTGIVKRIVRDKGFAFVTSQGVDYFAHASCFADLNGRRSALFNNLREGDHVSFEPDENCDRGPRALDIAA